MEFAHLPHPAPAPAEAREQALANPGFGTVFTDYMVRADYQEGRGWHSARIGPREPLTIDPACAVLHYAQEIFEGLKAYRHPDGSLALFRPEVNARRMNASADRLAMPRIPEELFIAACRELVLKDREWMPRIEGGSLYLRPFMFASEAFLGVRPAAEITYCVIASPAGSYFAGGVKPVSIWLSTDYSRAAPGGTGAAKCGGNYAASLVAQQEAAANGCDQVMFADAAEHAWLEELGGMNVYVVTADHELLTPELTGSILEGVTRESILTLASEFGLTPVERKIAIAELVDGIASGQVAELFACGTAAVITPIGLLKDEDGTYVIGGGETGETTAALRKNLLDIQYGRAADTHGWLRRVL